MKDKRQIALITGADHPTGLGTARALSASRLKLIGLCTNPASRYCRSRVWNRLSTVKNDPDAYLEILLDIGRSAPDKIALFPTQDELVLLVSENRDALAAYYDFVLPDKDAVDLLMDKTAFHEWAERHGFCVPESYIVDGRRQLEEVLNGIRYPVVIKPLYRTRKWQNNSPRDKILKIDKRQDFADIKFDLFEAAPRYVIQRWTPGGDSDVHFCLVYADRDGRELAHYTGRKLLQYPKLTGSSAICVGTFNSKLHEMTRDLFAAAGLKGLGSLEVKESSEDHRYYITEPTVGRNNLQSYIAVAGGVNLTQIAYEDALHKPTGHTECHPRLAMWVDEYFTLAALDEARKEKELHIKELFKSFIQPASFANLSIRDPLPFILFIKELFGRFVKKHCRHAS